jgi:hypothetical protein
MARGLVRKNNFSDLPSPGQARNNLGLATADYNRIRGLFTSAGVSNIDVQRIAGSANNYQDQIDSLSASLSGIVLNLYVERSGDTTTGTWTNYGYIQPGTLVQSGVVLGSSSDGSFSLTVTGLSYSLYRNTLVMQQGVTAQALRDNGAVVFASGVVANKLIPISINNVPYFLEAG